MAREGEAARASTQKPSDCIIACDSPRSSLLSARSVCVLCQVAERVGRARFVWFSFHVGPSHCCSLIATTLSEHLVFDAFGKKKKARIASRAEPSRAGPREWER